MISIHTLIRAIVYADDKDEAIQTAKSRVFEPLTRGPNGISTFDYYITLDHEEGEHGIAGADRWGHDLPAAAPVDSDEGQELIEGGWEATNREFRANLATIKLALEHLSDEEIREMCDDGEISLREKLDEKELEQVMDEHDVEMLNSLFDARHAMHGVGEYSGPNNWLYDGTDWAAGGAIRSRHHLETVIEERVPEDETAYVVPADVHH